MTLRTLAGLLAASMALSFAGCDSDISRHTGQRGEFVFEYCSEKDTHNFNKPIISGGRLELSVYSVGQEHAVDVTAAHSDSPETIRVDEYDGERVVLRGVAPGRAEVHVEGTTADGLTRVDIIALRVADAAVIDFDASRAWVTRMDAESDYLRVPTGSDVEIPWTLWSANGEPLVGYGAVPVTTDPADSADIDGLATDGDKVTLFMPSMPTVFELRPDDGYDGDTVVIEVYEPSGVAALADRAGLLRRGHGGDGHRWCDTPVEWATNHANLRAPLWMWLPALLLFPLLWWVRGKTYGRY